MASHSAFKGGSFILYTHTSGYLSSLLATTLDTTLRSALEAYQCTNHCSVRTRMGMHSKLI